MAAGAAVVAIPLIAQPGPASGPVARYDMRAGTVSGMGAMGAGGAMGMMFGGGRSSSAQHELYLRLGSSQTPAKGGPKADHFPPPGAKLGKSVALVTPREERGSADEMPQRPKGRLLIYWGCGEHAGRGQPVVIDFSRIAAGQMPPGLWNSAIARDWGPNLQNSRTFGRWPADDGKFVKPDTMLPGPHRVAGNYSPEMAFTLTKDFMAPLRINTSAMPSGASMLRWSGIPDVTGYLAVLFGGKQGPGGEMGDMVMWSSSATRQFGGGLGDWLSPSQVGALVRDRTVLPPAATSCVVPAEVGRDAPDFRFGTLTAFGPEESFSYPPRPADPRAAWNLQWTARIRHRSTTSWMQAPGMPAGMGGNGAGSQDCRPRGLGGLLGGGLGGSGC
ncbi:MAG: hypothetical protein JF595_04220 [Sphingomonadales bacterium]|nr:hypothetical protein [Sphingomonadales bacterium]